MVGGLVVSFFAGSLLTIKGPAAGLIVIVAGAVDELGHGDHLLGWKLALGAVVVAGVFQVIFGIFRLGVLSDFFPLSAVHGMLAAIGIIIISKQIHVLAGVNPTTEAGTPMVEPLQLLAKIPETISHLFAHKEVVLVGLVSLLIVFAWPMIKISFFKKIPASLVVLVVSIPLAMALGIHNVPEHIENGVTVKAYNALLSFDKGFFDILGVNVSFGGFSQLGTFIKFVIMFALVGSLEALLTVKAIDMLDPFKRKSKTNKDLIAIGIGNIVAGVLGGLPMISEVARSSANVSNGGKTRWANFFHGFFILLFLIFAVSFSNLIPLSALAAMLIGVGWKLTHPKEFGLMASIGLDQMAVFITTVVFTLATDLLVGIGAGILLKIILHVARGVSLHSLFNAKSTIEGTTVSVRGAALFSNFIKVKKQLLSFTLSQDITLDVRKCKLIDHSVLETLHHLKDDFEDAGGTLTILGTDEFKPVGKSKHPFAAVKHV